jgi:hypothetical protein
MAQSPLQRQAASGARKKADGFTRVTIQFARESVALLRRLSKRNKSAQAAAIALGLHVVGNEELLKELRERVAAKRATPEVSHNALRVGGKQSASTGPAKWRCCWMRRGGV